MRFKVGDMVQVIDEDIEGEVIYVFGNSVEILTRDQFQLTFKLRQIVKKEPLPSEIFINESIVILKGDVKPIPEKPNPVNTVWEVDLHAHRIIKSTKGMTNSDILLLQIAHARYKLKEAMIKGVKRIVFIHGVGEGILKMELETLLRRQNITTFKDGDYRKYGSGATEVYLS